MPIYDYKCKNCGKVSEILVNSMDNRTIYCPECHSSDMEKRFSSSYLIKSDNSQSGATCCGREERCSTPPCSSGNICQRR